MKRPQPDEYGEFYANYIALVNEDVFAELENQIKEVPAFLNAIPESKHNFAYAERKWTIKELLGHITDTERIMAYRSLRFSRKDETNLPGFEENEYVKNSTFDQRDFNNLVNEFTAIRQSNLFLFQTLTEEQLSFSGLANNNKVSVRALLFIMAGHVKHLSK